MTVTVFTTGGKLQISYFNKLKNKHHHNTCMGSSRLNLGPYLFCFGPRRGWIQMKL